MSIAENIFIGNMPAKGFFGKVDYKTMYEESKRLFEDMGVDIDVRRKVRGLGVAEQQLIMIAKALHRKSKIIIMSISSGFYIKITADSVQKTEIVINLFITLQLFLLLLRKRAFLLLV